MKVPKTFVPEKELTDIIKKALEEHEQSKRQGSKRQEPADLSKFGYDAVEFEYKDGTREVLRADCLKHRQGLELYSIDHWDLLTYFNLEEENPMKSICVTDENESKKVIKIINGNFIKAIRTNYLEE